MTVSDSFHSDILTPILLSLDKFYRITAHHLTAVLLERTLRLPVLSLLHGTSRDGAGKRAEVGFEYDR